MQRTEEKYLAHPRRLRLHLSLPPLHRSGEAARLTGPLGASTRTSILNSSNAFCSPEPTSDRAGGGGGGFAAPRYSTTKARLS